MLNSVRKGLFSAYGGKLLTHAQCPARLRPASYLTITMSSSWVPRSSVLHWLHRSQLQTPATFPQKAVKSCLKSRFVEEASQWTVYKTASPFNRRVTCIEWHPTYHNVAAFAAHSGSVYLWNAEDPSRDHVIEGIGYGYGCITDMKFNPRNPSLIYTTSVDGRFCLRDFEGRKTEVHLDTMDIQLWWCSMDVSLQYSAIFVGDSAGNAVILDLDGQTICKYRRLHRGKIKYAEFCPARSWTLATASNDHTVALWDIRMLRSQNTLTASRPTPVEVMEHEGVVTSARFDPIFGSRLLTTAQNSELRVYDPNNFSEPAVVVKHPHRHFQHMTDITASWHPFYENLCVLGRYPARDDKDQTRCIDLMDLESGQRLGYLHSSSLKGIIQINKFNAFGDSLASGMGHTCLLWHSPDQKSLGRARAEAKLRLERDGGGDRHSGNGRKRKRVGGGGSKEPQTKKKKL